MAINSQLSIESKKQSKQAEQEQIHRCGDHLKGYQLEGRRRMGEKVQALRSTIGRYKIDGGS